MNWAHIIWGPVTLLEIACIAWVAAYGSSWGLVVPSICLIFCAVMWRRSFLQERAHREYMARWDR